MNTIIGLTNTNRASTLADINGLVLNVINEVKTERFTYINIKSSSNPTFSTPRISTTEGNNVITLGNITGPGSIFIGVSNKTESAVPTREQLYNCVDGKNK